MIWNIIKQWFWCGVFHKTKPIDEHSPYYLGPNYIVCAKCFTEFEVLK